MNPEGGQRGAPGRAATGQAARPDRAGSPASAARPAGHPTWSSGAVTAVAAAAAVLLAAAGAAGASGKSGHTHGGRGEPAKPSPSALVSSSQAAMRRQAGVEEVASVVEGANRATITIHAGRVRGTELGSFDEKSQKGTARVVEVGSKAYLSADRNGLVASGFTAAAAGKEAGKWIAVAASSSYGRSLVAGLTIASAASELNVSGPQRLVLHVARDKRLGGTRVNVISASTSVETVELYVQAVGTPLPVELHARAGSTLSETIRFSHWGALPRAVAPRSSIALETGWLQSGTGG